MAKKNKGKIIPMLSPESYIRTKARSLPIYECVINADWQESKSVLLTVARKHTTGNITACYYFVDLMCLGVKNTHYVFNTPAHDYESAKIEMYEDFGREKIDYALAHNIVYASIEFAEDYGFKPHSKFTSLTRFVLEEDTDDIELIDIECGENGKPLYIRSPYESEHQANEIISQLEKTAGTDNFSFFTEVDDFTEDDYDEIDDDNLAQELEDNKKVFSKLYPRLNSLNTNEMRQVGEAANFIFEELTDPGRFDEYYDVFAELLNIEFDDGPLPPELFGLEPEEVLLANSFEEIYYEIFNLTEEKPKKARKLWEGFKDKAGNIASVYYLELMLLIRKEPVLFAEKLTQYYQMFPEFPLIKLLYLDHKLNSNDEDLIIQDDFYSFNYFYPERTNIHLLEIFNYMIFLLTLIQHQNDPSQLDAFHHIIEEMEDIPEKHKLILIIGIMSRKIASVADLLNLN
jgi:hypothetical protein